MQENNDKAESSEKERRYVRKSKKKKEINSFLSPSSPLLNFLILFHKYISINTN